MHHKRFPRWYLTAVPIVVTAAALVGCGGNCPPGTTPGNAFALPAGWKVIDLGQNVERHSSALSVNNLSTSSINGPFATGGFQTLTTPGVNHVFFYIGPLPPTDIGPLGGPYG